MILLGLAVEYSIEQIIVDCCRNTALLIVAIEYSSKFKVRYTVPIVLGRYRERSYADFVDSARID